MLGSRFTFLLLKRTPAIFLLKLFLALLVAGGGGSQMYSL